jgi:putative FmdB family regulatory protein
MPMFEYRCEDCGRRFEIFLTSGHRAICPHCQSQKLEKQISRLGRIGSGGGRIGSGGWGGG